MNIDRIKLASVALTLLMLTSVLPASIVSVSETARADHGGPVYTVRQPGTGVCHEVHAFGHDHPKMVPEVEVRGELEDYEEPRDNQVYGQYRDPDWNGFESIESIMDYRYRDDERGQIREYAPYLNDQYRYEPWEYSTYGLYNWSDNGESHMFLYQNARGEVSLVVRHDRLNDGTGIGSHSPYNGIHGPHEGFHESSPGGGAAAWTFEGLPPGEWAYIDDMYPREDMDDTYYDSSGTRYGHRDAEYTAEPLSEFNPADDGGFFEINWYWGSGGTDGGAYRGLHNLGYGEAITIDASFSNIDAWEVRNNDGSLNGDMKDLRMGNELVIRRGAHCPDTSLSNSLGGNPAEVGETVTFVADTDASVETYYWDFDGNGQAERNGSDASVPYTFNSTENRDVSVTVETSGGTRDSARMAVEVVQSEDPTARLNVEPGDRGLAEYHIVGEQLVFDASNSTDNSGTLASEYRWDFGDNTSGTGDARVAHTYDETGTYEVTVRVNDTAGNTDTETRTVEVVAPDERPPDAEGESVPATVEAGASFTLRANDSTDNRGIAAYRWDLYGDSGADAYGEQTTAAYDSPGQYNVTLTVEDGGGNTNATAVPVEVVPRQRPNVTDVSVPERVVAGQQFNLSGAAGDNGRIAEYRWVVDGEVVATGQRATHTFSADSSGQRTAAAQLVVVDAAGERNVSAEQTITVFPRDGSPPNASLSASTDQTKVGQTVTFNASNSTDEPHRDIEKYHWNFDGDNRTDATTSEPVVEHSYDSTGTYNATVRVEDGSGNVGNATVQIEVEAEKKAKDGGGGGGSSSVSTGPPPVLESVEKSGETSAVLDVRNVRGDEAVTGSLPDNVAASGVDFEELRVNLGSDDVHAAFNAEASAEAPEDAAELTATDETLAYVTLDEDYLDSEFENATVEFAVQKSELDRLVGASDVAAYRYDGSWERVNVSVVEETDDAYRLEATTDELGTLAVGADRTLSLGDAGLANETVERGETVEATLSVENAGDTARNVTVNLTLDGTEVTTKTVEVPADETEEVALTADAGEPGTYEVAVAGVSAGTLTVKEELTEPADVSVADVSLDAATIEAGEQVEITATVENTGGKAGEREVSLRLFGEELATETVEVPAGETKTVTFTQRVDAPGNYTVKVNDETAELAVKETQIGGDDGPNAPDVPGFGVGTAVVALLAAALLARLRG